MRTAALVEVRPPSETVMSLLSRGIPLSLLLDLVCGPHSEDLLNAERIPAQRRATA